MSLWGLLLFVAEALINIVYPIKFCLSIKTDQKAMKAAILYWTCYFMLLLLEKSCYFIFQLGDGFIIFDTMYRYFSFY